MKTNTKLNIIGITLIIGIISAIIMLTLPGKISIKKGIFSKDSFYVINIDGLISYSTKSSMFGGNSVDRILTAIKKIEKSKNIKGVILRINSPGGTIGAVEEIYNAILRLKKSGKKVVASLKDVAASGGYYIASAADMIIANHGTITGSIGVIISSLNIKRLAQKYGIRLEVIKSGKFKDSLSMFRDLSPEERKWLESLIQDAYMGFYRSVYRARYKIAQKKGISNKQFKSLCDGRIFTGNIAKRYGFIDKIGDMEVAIEELRKLCHLKKRPKIIYPKQRNMWEELFSISGIVKHLFTKKNIERSITKNPIPISYIWEAGIEIYK